jgi:hypothetical protein
MRALVVGTSCLLALAASTAAGQMEIAAPVEAAPVARSGVSGATLGSAPLPLALTVSAPVAASLAAAPALASPRAGAAAAAAAAPAAAVAGVPAVPAAALAPALAEPAPLPAAAAATPASAPALKDAARPAGAGAAPGRDESSAAAGRALFDAAAPAAPDAGGLWAKVRDWARLGDRVPSWPGSAGEKIRLAGRSYTLDRRLADGGGSRVWKTTEGDLVVKILHPQFLTLPHYADEAAVLRAIRNSDIPHARLVAASADGTVMVKELVEGDGAGELLAGGFEDRHRQGWEELAAKLIRAGVTADLVSGNLVWQRARGRWMIVDAGGIEDAGPEKVLAQLLTPAAVAAGVEPGAFLAGLRARLGPDSPEWARTLAALGASPKYAAALAALAARDRALPPAPQIRFGPAPESAPYPDAVGRAGAAAKALGYDPLTAKPRTLLHGDDPGKLNTKVFLVEPPGKTPAVVKIAQWSIVRNELAVRRVVRRFFGAYFDAPSAFGVSRGLDSYLVMEPKPGTRSYAQNPLSLERRAALAVLVHAFGLSDVNPGNVLFPARGRPVLIDFEQALSRQGPVGYRLPDERIAMEMPWLSRFEPNRVEDYQPAIRAWRALLAEPAARAALVADFVAAGFTPAEAAGVLRTVELNTADLDWALQNDVDFVNQFARRRQAPR